MNSQRIVVYKLILIIIRVLIIKGDRHKYKNHYGHHTQATEMTFDYLGNCYIDAIDHKGRCVRYQECESALKAWQKYQTFPYSCYYTSHDNVVCCPEAFIKPKKEKSFYNYYYNNNAFLNMMATQEERKNEEICSSIYNNFISNRVKRYSNISEFSVDSLQTVQEEPIKKVQVTKTQAVGGIETIPNEFPYMCVLGWRRASAKRNEIFYSCGCVLIDRKYVLTAAHCAAIGGESPSIVRLGGVNLDDHNAEVIKIQRIIQHPEYNSQLHYNDIAVVKLQKGSRHTPACLWANVGLPQQTLIAMGYGHTKFAGSNSNTLLKVYLNVLTNENCNSYYSKEDKLKHGISLGQICAGDPEGKMDTCQGDSGGPLLLKETKYNTQVPFVVGLTSFGEGCATNTPSVYTRISFYIDWIEQIVWK